jgi:hypothetical protein
MASLGALATMMRDLYSNPVPVLDPLQMELDQQRVRAGRRGEETGLVELQRLREEEQARQLVLDAYRRDPRLLTEQYGLGQPGPPGPPGQPQSPLMSLGGPGAGAITQQTMRPPDQVMGTPGVSTTQQVPTYPDLSQFATGQSPSQPQPTLAGLQRQPQGFDLDALTRQNPQAAMMLMARQQQAQEQQLTLRTNILKGRMNAYAFASQLLTGVTDQASLDQARAQIATFDQGMAADIPQTFTTKEALQPLIQRGTDIKGYAEAQYKQAQARQLDAKIQTQERIRLFREGLGRDEEPAGPPGEAAPPAGTTATAAPVSEAFRTKTAAIEQRLGMQKGDLLRIMDFETGGTFSPAQRNQAGSGATGLIQFMPDTAKALGTTTEALAAMSPEQQLDMVEKYLSKYKGRIGSLEDAYMAVLYPEAIGKGGGYRLFTEGTKAYEQNAALDTDKKGYVTVDDAVRAVQRRGGARPAGTTTAQVSAASSPEMARLDRQIRRNEQIYRLYEEDPETYKDAMTELRQSTQNLEQRKKVLEDRAIAERHRQEPSPARIAEQEAGRALAPIERTMAESLSTNKSIYNSIGKMESVMREGAPDLPADFVSLVAEDAPGIRDALERDDPKLTGMLQQWYTKLSAASKNDPRVNRFLSALAQIRDLVIFERSGGSVTGNELTRATGAFLGSLPNVNQAFSLFMQNLANVKETVTDRLVTMGASVRPLSGGKAVYGGLPREVRERIEAYERGEEYTPKRTAQAAPVQGRGRVAGPVRQVD